jgi:DNA-directed RNA polymerase specialized sigma24 family protein
MTITQAQFDSLLVWLSPDREIAGKKYKTIHSGLVRIFVSKGLNNAEDLADETINRVMVRLSKIEKDYHGEPACYFHGVARNIIRECKRRKELAIGNVDITVQPETDAFEGHDCLRRCLDRLSDTKRNLILDYYLHEGHSKVEHHKHMAGELRTTLSAIRSRAFQIRLDLHKCMRRCALNGKAKTKPPRTRSNAACRTVNNPSLKNFILH